MENNLDQVTLRNKEGEKIGTLTYKPFDFGIPVRYTAFREKLNQITFEQCRNMNTTPDGLAADPAEAEALEQTEQQLYEAINELFGTDTAKDLFSIRRPFANVHGRFFCTEVLTISMDYIGSQNTKKAAEAYKAVTANQKKPWFDRFKRK